MTIRSRVARLDDASGELALSLAKLEMEAARGALSVDEEIDFLHDLHRATYRRVIRPWGVRSLQALGAGIVLLAAAWLLPPALPYREAAGTAAILLAGLAVLSAGVLLGIYLRNLGRERRWFKRQEAGILGGGSILEDR